MRTGALTHGDTEGVTRIGTSTAVPDVLRSLDVDPDRLLREAGFVPELFEDPENLVGYRARGRLFDFCAAETHCEHFGLLVGQKAGLRSLGLIGLLAEFSPDVETALNKLVTLFFLQVQGATLNLTVDHGYALFSYLSYDRNASGVEQVGDGALAVMFNIMRTLCGPGWQPEEVRFAHVAPKEPKPYRDFFRARLRFDAEQYTLVFSHAWLKQLLPSSDPALLKVLQREVDRLTDAHRGNLAEQVKLVLRRSIPAGHYEAGEIAALFAMHPRTLDRRLARFGTTFRELLTEARFEIARQLLEGTTLSVTRIATILGYSRASSFGRAFKRWTSGTPREWRKTARENHKVTPELPEGAEDS